jgi:RNA polymerase sigma factor (sigma-70 family)
MSEPSRAPSAPRRRASDGDGRRRSVGTPHRDAGAVEAALREHHDLMLRRARRVSLCEDDAHDAVQAAAERYLRYHQRVDPETRVGWLVTVTRNEALRIRNSRIRIDGPDPDEQQLPHHGDSPAELAERGEDLELAREALAGLKPQERQALMLQAEGHSYDEIADRLDWTRTKVNRNLTEGRARLRKHLRGIAAGESCASAKPRIDRLARGDASADDLIALRPHLRRCTSCRARLRRARGGQWVAVPPVLLGWLPWVDRLGGAPPARGRVGTLVADRLATLLPAGGSVGEAGFAVTAGVATALAAGTLVVTTDNASERPKPITPSTHRAQADPGLLTAGATPTFRAPATTSAPTADRKQSTPATTGSADRSSTRDREAPKLAGDPPAGATAQREFGPETAPAASASSTSASRSSGPSAAASSGRAAPKPAISRSSADREFGIE